MLLNACPSNASSKRIDPLEPSQTKQSQTYPQFYQDVSHVVFGSLETKIRNFTRKCTVYISARSKRERERESKNSQRRRVESHRTRVARYFQAFTRNSRQPRGNAKELSCTPMRRARTVRSNASRPTLPETSLFSPTRLFPFSFFSSLSFFPPFFFPFAPVSVKHAQLRNARQSAAWRDCRALII